MIVWYENQCKLSSKGDEVHVETWRQNVTKQRPKNPCTTKRPGATTFPAIFFFTDVISRLPDAEVARQMREAEFQPKPWGCGRGSTELEGD